MHQPGARRSRSSPGTALPSDAGPAGSSLAVDPVRAALVHGAGLAALLCPRAQFSRWHGEACVFECRGVRHRHSRTCEADCALANAWCLSF